MIRGFMAGVAVLGIVMLGSAGAALAQKANPCAAKNPCAPKNPCAAKQPAAAPRTERVDFGSKAPILDRLNQNQAP